MSKNSGVSACCDDGAIHVRIDGHAVAHDCPALRQYVETAVEDGCRKVFVHLDQCEHFDSTFLGTLLCLRRFAEGADPIELQLVNTSEAAATIIRRMGAASLFRSCSGEVPTEDAGWSTCESEQAGNCSREFKQNVVQAHQQLAEVDGPLGATYRQVAEMAAQDLEAAQDQ